MSDLDETIRLALDGTSMETGLQDIVTILTKYNQTIQQVGKVSEHLDGATGNLIQTVQVLLGNFDKLTVKATTTAEGIRTVTTAIDDGTQRAKVAVEKALAPYIAGLDAATKATEALLKGQIALERSGMTRALVEQAQAATDLAKANEAIAKGAQKSDRADTTDQLKAQAQAATDLAKANEAIAKGAQKSDRADTTDQLKAQAKAAQDVANADAAITQGSRVAERAKMVAALRSQAQASVDVAKADAAILQGERDLDKQNREARLKSETQATKDLARANEALAKGQQQADRQSLTAQLKADAQPGFLGQVGSSVFGSVTAATLAANAITFLGGELKDAAKEAVNLDRQMSRLALIDASLNRGKLYEIAGSYNANVADVGTAYGRAAATTGARGSSAAGIVEAGAKLAQVTGGDVVGNTAALTATMQSFHKSAGDAADVSAQLFGAWKQGIDVSGTLAQSIGRLGLVAEPLGVKMEEALATIEVFKSKGASEAQAVFATTNFLTRLLAPTDLLKQKFEELGHTTADGVIKQYGFAKLLEVVFKDTKDVSGVTEEFKNAIGGVNKSAVVFSGLASEVIQKQREMKESTEDLNTSLSKIQAGPGEALTQQWNAFTNMLKEAAMAAGTAAMVPSLGKPVKLRGHDYVPPDLEDSRIKSLGPSPEERARFLPIQETISKVMRSPLTQFAGDMTQDSLQKAIYERQYNDLNTHLGEKFAKLQEYHRKERDEEKVTTENIKDELNVRIHRFEDAVRTQSQVAERARAIAKASAGRVEEGADSFATGRYNRQMSLLSPGQQKNATLASIFDQPFNVSSPFGDSGNPAATHLSNLKADRNSLFANAMHPTGDAFLDSKNVDRAVAKSNEVKSILEQQAATVIEMYKNHQVGQEAVIAAEAKITNEYRERVDLEKQLQAAAAEKEASSKKEADEQKLRLEKVANYTREAIGINFTGANGSPTLDESLKKYDAAIANAQANAKGTKELSDIANIASQHHAQIEAQGRRKDEDALISGDTDKVKALIGKPVETVNRVFLTLEQGINEVIARYTGKAVASNKVEGFGGYAGSIPGVSKPRGRGEATASTTGTDLMDVQRNRAIDNAVQKADDEAKKKGIYEKQADIRQQVNNIIASNNQDTLGTSDVSRQLQLERQKGQLARQPSFESRNSAVLVSNEEGRITSKPNGAAQASSSAYFTIIGGPSTIDINQVVDGLKKAGSQGKIKIVE